MADIPVVYTLTVCPACDVFRSAWDRQGISYEERRVDQSQETLDEALEELRGDKLVQESMGVIYDEFVGLKEAEWREYHRQVTPWELDRYLTMF